MGKQKRLTKEVVQEKHKKLKAWELLDNNKLTKSFSFKNFKEALEFTNEVGGIAEDLNHHPDIYLTWGKVLISIQTHELDNLTDKDFELAEAIDHRIGLK